MREMMSQMQGMMGEIMSMMEEAEAASEETEEQKTPRISGGLISKMAKHKTM